MATAKPDWLVGRGTKAATKASEDSARDFGPRRFWLAPGKSTQIVFVDDNPLVIDEHQVCIDGKWTNWATCTRDEDCPLCAIGDDPSTVSVWSIIDRSEWKDKKGQKHKDELRLFVAKPRVAGKLAMKSERLRKARNKKDGLVGVAFEVARGDAKSAATGDDFEAIGKASKLIAGVEVPNYEDIFKPNLKLLNRYARKLASAGPGGGRASDPKDDDIDDDIDWNE